MGVGGQERDREKGEEETERERNKNRETCPKRQEETLDEIGYEDRKKREKEKKKPRAKWKNLFSRRQANKTAET